MLNQQITEFNKQVAEIEEKFRFQNFLLTILAIISLIVSIRGIKIEVKYKEVLEEKQVLETQINNLGGMYEKT